MGDIVINCPNSKDQVRKRNYKRHHYHAIEDVEPDQERTKEDDSSKEYVLISSLTGTVTRGSDTCLIDSGASNHITGYKDYFSKLFQKDSPQKVKLGDDY
jgi:hypothetical protein